MAPPSSLVNKTSPIKNTFLILLLGLLGFIILKTFCLGSQHEKSAARSLALVDCYRAEMLMRMVDAMSYLSQFPTIKADSLKNNAHKTYSTVAAQAKELLEKAAKGEPNNIVILSKKIILESRSNDDIKIDINKLALLANSTQVENTSAANKELALTIQSIYGSHTNDKSGGSCELSIDTVPVINKNLSDGWFREQVLLKVYSLNHQIKEQEVLQIAIQNKTWHYIFKIVLITIGGTIAAIIGALVLLYQIVTNVRQSADIDKELNKKTHISSQSSSEYNWQTVAFVFVAWFFTQIIIGFIFTWLKQKGLSLEFTQSNSLVSAASIALIYLLSNGPALLYIYFLALKPKGRKFIEGINLRLKVGNYGTIALIAIGILGWFAALPLVIVAYFISATFLGSSGSSNPIIAIVMEAAQANNVFTILLFYLTLGVLAPLCEETLFRGFLYSYLRTRNGVMVSNLISSSLFAIAHMDIGAILPLFCLGSIFACVYEKTKSIWPAMIAHGLWNSATFTLVLMLFGG